MPVVHPFEGIDVYRFAQIPLDEAISLLTDSLLFARWYPDGIIARPTFIGYLPRLALLRDLHGKT